MPPLSLTAENCHINPRKGLMCLIHQTVYLNNVHICTVYVHMYAHTYIIIIAALHCLWFSSTVKKLNVEHRENIKI